MPFWWTTRVDYDEAFLRNNERLLRALVGIRPVLRWETQQRHILAAAKKKDVTAASITIIAHAPAPKYNPVRCPVRPSDAGHSLPDSTWRNAQQHVG